MDVVGRTKRHSILVLKNSLEGEDTAWIRQGQMFQNPRVKVHIQDLRFFRLSTLLFCVTRWAHSFTQFVSESASKTSVVHHFLTINRLSTAIIIPKTLIDIIAILQGANEEIFRLFARMSAKILLKGIRKGEEDSFLAFQSRSAAGQS